MLCGELVVCGTGSCKALLPVSPEDAGGWQSQDRDIDTGGIHIFDALIVVEMRGFQDAEAGPPVEDRFRAIETFSDFEVRSTVLAQ